jgi:hypothetical protein
MRLKKKKVILMKWGYEPLFNPGSHSVVVITLDFDMEANPTTLVRIQVGALSGLSSDGRAMDCSSMI